MRILDSEATAYYLPHHRISKNAAHANNGSDLSVKQNAKHLWFTFL